MPFCQRSRVFKHAVFQLFLQFIPKLQQILTPAPERVPATPLFQAHSCLQDERYRAAEFIAADPLNDGFPQTSQLAGEHGNLARGSILPGPTIICGPLGIK